ncbi:hypothetical protein KR018_003009 [Drosophila ironensis]|nr:hypothetical protein KR018_003009 [Drosophila ironensis]
MGIALMFLLALYQMQSAIHSEIIETPYLGGGNSLLDSGDADVEVPPQVALPDSEALEPEKAQLEFSHPVSVIGIDYGKNAVILRFQKHGRKPRYKYDPELEAKRRSLQDNFMHFGKRQAEQPSVPTPPEDEPDLDVTKRAGMDRYGRDPKQDFIRFGRDPKQDFMRFGRDPKQDFMRFGRAPSDFMRFGRAPSDFMRFGRTPSEDFMRFGRGDNFMRFGRSPQEQLRSPKQDFMRFGRPDNFMRFGRSAPPEFVRSGKMDSNFIRFGKSVTPAVVPESDPAKPGQSGKPGERSPVDAALLKKHQEQQDRQDQQQAPAPVPAQDEEQEAFFGQ